MDLVLLRRRLRRPKRRGGLVALRFAVIGFGGLILAAFSLVALAAVGALTVYATYVSELPSAEEIGQMSAETLEPTRIYDSTGEVLLHEIIPAEGGRHTNVPLEQIPEALRNGTIAMEDKTFYTNPGGINIEGLGRAVWGLVTDDYAGGGSSITQQLVRNVIMTFEERMDQSISRKIKELVLSVELTRRYSGKEGRDQILEWYLNNIDYGHMAIGVEAAAQTYFGKHVQDLSLADCAMLVPVGNSPARNPIDRPEEAIERRNMVLDYLYMQGYITAEEAWEAKQEPAPIPPAAADMTAPHYVLYVTDILEEQYGFDVYHGGLEIITALNLDTQFEAQRLAREQVNALSEKHNAHNAAIVVVDSKTGELEALVGSIDFWDESIDGQVNMALSPRQPGSSFKPYTYAAAFAQGYTAATMVMDVRTSFPDPGNPAPYVPENYSRTFHGPMLLRRALACSYNIPAVATEHQVGVENVVATARAVGITTLDDDEQYGLSLTLGGYDVTLLDMTYAFSVFANNGTMVGVPTAPSIREKGLRQLDPVAVLQVTDTQGNVLYEFKGPQKQQVLRPEVAYLITDILSDNAARTPAFGPDSVLTLSDRPAAAKTGTTNDYYDGWTLGYTPQYTVGVWVGNTNHEKMENAPGVRAAGPIWQGLMSWLHQNLPVESFARPPGLVSVVVDGTSGKLPTEYSPWRTQELFIEGTEPSEYDDVHQPFRICRVSGKLATPYCPPEEVEQVVFDIYPSRADDWVREQSIPQPPAELCDLHGPNLASSPVAITSPSLLEITSGVVPIVGNARPSGFERYWLEYGKGMSPSQWVRIGGDHWDIVDNNVLEFWDTTGHAGAYTLRLNVAAAGGIQQFAVSVRVDNSAPQLTLLSPAQGQEYVIGEDEWINIQASALDDTSMDRVEFYLDGETLGFSTVAPYTMRWDLVLANEQPQYSFDLPAPIVEPAGEGVRRQEVTRDGDRLIYTDVLQVGEAITQTQVIREPNGAISWTMSWPGGRKAQFEDGQYSEIHRIHVVARDAAGKETVSDSVDVVVLPKPREDE